jgi:hypothetical protein
MRYSAATNIATNLARGAKDRHYFVAILHPDCDSPDPAPNGQIRFATMKNACCKVGQYMYDAGLWHRFWIHIQDNGVGHRGVHDLCPWLTVNNAHLDAYQ